MRGKKQEDWKTNQTVDFYYILCIVVCGFAIRVWQFGMIPDGMRTRMVRWQQLMQKALADHGTDRYGMYMPVHFLRHGDMDR